MKDWRRLGWVRPTRLPSPRSRRSRSVRIETATRRTLGEPVKIRKQAPGLVHELLSLPRPAHSDTAIEPHDLLLPGGILHSAGAVKAITSVLPCITALSPVLPPRGWHPCQATGRGEMLGFFGCHGGVYGTRDERRDRAQERRRTPGSVSGPEDSSRRG